MRIAGLLLMIAALALLLGCPQPIENGDDATPDDDGTVSADVSMYPTGDDAGDADNGAAVFPDDDDPATEPGDTGEEDDMPAVDNEATPEKAGDDPETGIDAVTPDLEPIEPVDEGPNGDEVPFILEKPAPPGPEISELQEPEPAVEEPAEEETGPTGALDPGRMLATEPVEPEPAFSEPAPRISRESYAFAGEWTVAVIHQDGRAEQLPADDAWTFSLADDGKCGVTQVVDREEWTQRGGWEYVGGELTLRLGPGGQREYEVFQPEEDPDVAILTDGDTGAVLFCLRIDPAVRVPKPAKRYESDFGPVSIRQSGQVYWTGTYGEPEGTLNFRMAGQYMAGTWEQRPGNGFVLLKLTKDGFSGWWWYEASTEFDGTWRGTAQ